MPKRFGQSKASFKESNGLVKSFKLWWLLLNTLLIVYLLSRRLSGKGEPLAYTSPPTCRHHHHHHHRPRPCDPPCREEYGVCLDGVCKCNKGWSGGDCSFRVCPNDCNGNGLCLDGICICNRRYTGEDCSVDVAILKEDEIYEAVSDKMDKSGRIDRQIPHFVNARQAKKYHYEFCRTKACQATWLTQLVPLVPLLPRDDVKLRYPSCAIVSSGKNIVYNSSSNYEDSRAAGRGEDIDKHRAVFRFNNAPTENVEKWVGRRTTHRLVEADYAQMVQGMLGTEVTVNQTKSIVTPTTWWVGGYPQVQKVTYLMSVYPSKIRNQIRAPSDNNGYGPFAEIFPGNRHYLFSPQFLNEVGDIYGKYREMIKSEGLGCYKAKSLRVPQMFTALVYSLQVCQKVHIYGLSQTSLLSDPHKKDEPRANTRRHSKDMGGESCCYYKVVDDFSSRNPICDALTKNHIIRVLLKTNRIFLYD